MQFKMKRAKKKIGHNTTPEQLWQSDGWFCSKRPASIVFSLEAALKIWALLSRCTKEVGWNCTVTRIGDGPHFYIDKVFIFPQTVHCAETHEDKNSSWLGELPDEDYKNLRFYGHSHANFMPVPSGFDMNFRKELMEQYCDCTGFEEEMKEIDMFYIFMIFNRHNQHTAEIKDIQNKKVYRTTDISLDIRLPDGKHMSEIVIPMLQGAKKAVKLKGEQKNGFVKKL